MAIFPTYRLLLVAKSQLRIPYPTHAGRRRLLEPERILRLEPSRVVFLDQRRLPLEEVEVECRTAAEVADGDPDDGRPRRTRDRHRGRVRLRARRRARARTSARPSACSRESRPTAVNLGWALDEMRGDPSAEHARAIHRDEVARCRAMAAHAAGLLAAGCARADALQRGRPRDRRVRQRGRRARARVGAGPARARLGRRDAAAAAGRAPDRVGARDSRRSRTR